MAEILFLSHRIPWPPDRGDKIRSHHLLHALARLAPVHVASFVETAADRAAEPALAALAASHCLVQRRTPVPLAALGALARGEPVSLAAFRDQAIARFVATTLAARPIGAIVVFSGQMAQYVPGDFAGRVLLDLVDVDSAKFEDYAARAALPLRWVHAREARLLGRFEGQAARRADITTLVSVPEAALLRDRIGGAADIRALGNGIDTVHYDPAQPWPTPWGAAAGPHLVFTGQMDYPPNMAAVETFARQTMPLLRRAYPDTRFHIVGRQPSPGVRALAALPGVDVTGAVDDTRLWLAAADIVVAPLQIARGVQNKVLEAMAMARPVVLSAAAAQGIEADNGAHFVIADGAEAEAAAICGLIAAPEVAAAIGQAARAHVVQHYGWAARLAPLAGWLGMGDAAALDAAA